MINKQIRHHDLKNLCIAMVAQLCQEKKSSEHENQKDLSNVKRNYHSGCGPSCFPCLTPKISFLPIYIIFFKNTLSNINED